MSPEALKHHYTLAQQIAAETAGVLFIIPLAPFLCRFIPPVFIESWNIDLLIAIIISIIIVRLLIWLVRPIVIPAFLIVCCVLAYSQFHNHLTFRYIANSYKTMVTQNWAIREHKQFDDLSLYPNLFEGIGERTSRFVKLKVQYKDSLVRNFAVEHSIQYFDAYHYKYREIARYLSLFKYINSNFKYVPDVNRDEYYATPKETILNGLGGDCDDHSILMASALMSIGATCRLVIIEGHMYPELYVGNERDFDIVQQAILLFFSNEKIDRIYYHENNGEYWLNLDYTARYPGGPYINDKVKLVINLP